MESPGHVHEGAENSDVPLSQWEVRKQTALSKMWVTLLDQQYNLEGLRPKTQTRWDFML